MFIFRMAIMSWLPLGGFYGGLAFPLKPVSLPYNRPSGSRAAMLQGRVQVLMFSFCCIKIIYSWDPEIIGSSTALEKL